MIAEALISPKIVALARSGGSELRNLVQIGVEGEGYREDQGGTFTMERDLS